MLTNDLKRPVPGVIPESGLKEYLIISNVC